MMVVSRTSEQNQSLKCCKMQCVTDLPLDPTPTTTWQQSLIVSLSSLMLKKKKKKKIAVWRIQR